MTREDLEKRVDDLHLAATFLASPEGRAVLDLVHAKNFMEAVRKLRLDGWSLQDARALLNFLRGVP